MGKREDVYEEALQYVARITSDHRRGEDVYYARLALEQAIGAGEAGNFGIGAVAVLRVGNDVREFRAGNALFSGGLGVVDHAEVRAILKWREGQPPDDDYPADDEAFANFPEGLQVFGTVEPCPMCACAMTHVGAARSVSTVLDGDLIQEDGQLISDGGAMAIGPKGRLQPRGWRAIQKAQGLTFELLSTDDGELLRLSKQVWKISEREAVDRLARRSG